jgi:hypothetical protein
MNCFLIYTNLMDANIETKNDGQDKIKDEIKNEPKNDGQDKIKNEIKNETKNDGQDKIKDKIKNETKDDGQDKTKDETKNDGQEDKQDDDFNDAINMLNTESKEQEDKREDDQEDDQEYEQETELDNEEVLAFNNIFSQMLQPNQGLDEIKNSIKELNNTVSCLEKNTDIKHVLNTIVLLNQRLDEFEQKIDKPEQSNKNDSLDVIRTATQNFNMINSINGTNYFNVIYILLDLFMVGLLIDFIDAHFHVSKIIGFLGLAYIAVQIMITLEHIILPIKEKVSRVVSLYGIVLMVVFLGYAPIASYLNSDGVAENPNILLHKWTTIYFACVFKIAFIQRNYTSSNEIMKKLRKRVDMNKPNAEEELNAHIKLYMSIVNSNSSYMNYIFRPIFITLLISTFI